MELAESGGRAQPHRLPTTLHAGRIPKFFSGTKEWPILGASSE